MSGRILLSLPWLCASGQAIGANDEMEDIIKDCSKCTKSIALFVGGMLFGSVGFKLLASRDAKKVYTHVTAAGLRVKECAMETATSLREQTGDILADAKELNLQRKTDEETEVVEDTATHD